MGRMDEPQTELPWYWEDDEHQLVALRNTEEGGWFEYHVKPTGEWCEWRATFDRGTKASRECLFEGDLQICIAMCEGHFVKNKGY